VIGARRIAGAAALIAALTVASRVVGFGRIVVFAWAVGPTDLGTTYQTTNTIPNIVFEIVAGGALASLVVPVLAGPLARGDRATVHAAASALLTWTVVLLVPLAVLVAVAAEPIVGLLSAQAPPEMVATGARMLRVFAPQLPLYGLGIVLTGVLQAHRRFGWPAVAPLLSSLMVIGAYAVFAVVGPRHADVGQVGRTGELVLSVGTTAGVAVLAGCLLVPLRRLGVRLRPTFALPAEARTRIGGLAAAAVVTVAAQQIATALVLYLANPPAPTGALVVFTIAQAAYLLPWAVLAVPVATSAYPVLAAAAETADTGRYRSTLAGAARGVVLLSCLGAAALVGVAAPAGRILGVVAGGNVAGPIAAAVAGFAPGLIGYGLFALLSRALYARGDTRPAAAATAIGWGVVMAATLALAAALPPGQRVLALVLGNSIGMTALALALAVLVVRRTGREALAGLPRATGTGLLAGVVAAAAGVAVGLLFSSATPGSATPNAGVALAQGMLSGVVVLVVFAALAWAVDRHDVRPLVAGLAGRLHRLARRRRAQGDLPAPR